MERCCSPEEGIHSFMGRRGGQYSYIRGSSNIGDSFTLYPSQNDQNGSMLSSVPCSAQIVRSFPISSPIKLFVNRIPKWMSDGHLRRIFQHFGKVLQCNILFNKLSESKGCAFIKYSSISDAYHAILNLHGRHILDPSLGPIQIRYADGEIARLGFSENIQPGGESVKVFIGCLPNFYTEDAVFTLFSKYGRVDEVFIFRDKHKKSRCSAFVVFPKMSMATSAILALNNYHLTGTTRPLKVRLAKSKSEYRTKKQ